jgi:SAM-dependent methyltransferase
MFDVQPRLARPYSKLAETYDIGLGMPFFVRTRLAFESLVKRYGIRFRSAADIGCGTGLFACYLSQCWSVPVFAVDRSAEMLNMAQRNCREPRLCFLQQDIRCLRLPHPVDLITANFDTLNHLLFAGELRETLRRVCENLNPGGHFIFDLLTHCQPCEVARGISIPLRAKAGREMWQQIRWHPRQGLLSVNVVMREPTRMLPKIEMHRERVYPPEAVCRWLQEAGFVLRGLHDAATLRVTEKCPPRVIIIVKRPPVFTKS